MVVARVLSNQPLSETVSIEQPTTFQTESGLIENNPEVMSAFANFNDELNNCYVSVSEPATYHHDLSDLAGPHVPCRSDLAGPPVPCSALSLDSCSTAVASAAVSEVP